MDVEFLDNLFRGGIGRSDTQQVKAKQLQPGLRLLALGQLSEVLSLCEAGLIKLAALPEKVVKTETAVNRQRQEYHNQNPTKDSALPTRVCLVRCSWHLLDLPVHAQIYC